MGCFGNAEGEYIYPPNEVEYHGERTRTRTCPVKMCSPDVMDLFRAWHLCDGRLSIEEQDSLPPTYLTAWELAGHHISRAQSERMKNERQKS